MQEKKFDETDAKNLTRPANIGHKIGDDETVETAEDPLDRRNNLRKQTLEVVQKVARERKHDLVGRRGER